MRFVEDISRFYGTGEKNKQGQTLEEYLDGYDPRQFDLPSNTTDVIVVRCEEELKNWNQKLEVLLIKRANHPGIGFWATPGGFVEMREHLDDGAARELEEETGYTTDKELELLITINTTPAFCNEKIDIYVATDLKPGEQHLDEDEVVTYQAFTVAEIQEMILTGKMTDAKTISAIMSYAAKYLSE